MNSRAVESQRIGLNRRQFLKSNLAAALATSVFPTLIPASARGRNGRPAPSSRITVGIIGCGPQGRGVLGNFLNQSDCQVVAACDLKPDQLNLAVEVINARYGNRDCRAYQDFRELVARADLDACLIATPDHWHVLNALAAVRAGEDVYLEKPLALTLAERQALRAAVRRHQRVFQFGTQQRSSRHFRLACALVRNGRIGALKHINVWAPGSAPGGSRKVVPAPAGLDYNFWVGPAPWREHTEHLVTADNAAKTWWFVSNFTLGFISGWGIHPMDIAVWGAGDRLGDWVSVEGRGNFRPAEGICDTATIWEVDYAFATGLTMKFVGVPNGGNRGLPTGEPFLYEPEWKARYRRISEHGTAFEGADGWVHVDRVGLNLQPEELIDLDADKFPTRLVRSSSHVRNFLDCVRHRAETVCPVETAVLVDNLCHAADLAVRLGRKVTLDLRKEIFRNDAEANARFKSRPMRAPWKL